MSERRQPLDPLYAITQFLVGVRSILTGFGSTPTLANLLSPFPIEAIPKSQRFPSQSNEMPTQLSKVKKNHRATAAIRPRKMVTAWLCLSTSLTVGTRAAFIRNSAIRSTNGVGKVALHPRNNQGLNTLSFARLSTTRSRSSSETLLSASVAADETSSKPSSTEAYDLLNKERGLDTYNPSAFESDIYKWWESSGCFQPDAKQEPKFNDDGEDVKKPYVLPMPPPNVTGRLHMGHAIFVALQDVLARFHRMRGRPVLWLPGMWQLCSINHGIYLFLSCSII